MPHSVAGARRRRLLLTGTRPDRGGQVVPHRSQGGRDARAAVWASILPSPAKVQLGRGFTGGNQLQRLCQVAALGDAWRP